VDARPRAPAHWLDAEKKSLVATERNEAQRQAFRTRIAQQPADAFVIVDETGSNLNLTPRYARAPRGRRAIGKVPRNTPPNTTLIAAMTTAGMAAAMVLDGATDTAAFLVYVEHFLVPTLRSGQIVVLDNLRAHHHSRVHELVEATGCTVWYLPAYSPDLSPIEEAFAKLKTLLRRAAARTKAALLDAITSALAHITAMDAHGFFKHCGYTFQHVADQ
jgi:transposase